MTIENLPRRGFKTKTSVGAATTVIKLTRAFVGYVNITAGSATGTAILYGSPDSNDNKLLDVETNIGFNGSFMLMADSIIDELNTPNKEGLRLVTTGATIKVSVHYV